MKKSIAVFGILLVALFFSAFTSYYSPSTPSLVSPSANETNVALDKLMDWSDCTGSGTITYHIQIGTVQNFSSGIAVDVQGISASQLQLAGDELQNGTVYYFRVQAEDNSGFGSFSQVRSFTTVSE